LVETSDPVGVTVMRSHEGVKVGQAGPFETAYGAVKLLLTLLTPVELQMLKAVQIPAAFRAIPQKVTEMAPPTDAELDRLLAEVRGGRAAELAMAGRM
jgi:hypothetical protein